MENIIFERQGGIGLIYLNRPASLNCLTMDLLQDLHDILDVIEHDDSIRVLVITGRGTAFCAGADLKEVIKFKDSSELGVFLKRGQVFFNRLETLRKPVIACINGLALGGGCELALACDIRIASEEALLGLPEVKVGIIPAAGGTTKLARIVGLTRATEMLFLGSLIKADEALRIGLVTRVVSKEHLKEETDEVARVLANERSPEALSALKEIVKLGSTFNTQECLDLEIAKSKMLYHTDHMKEGMNAFVEKRKPVFQFK